MAEPVGWRSPSAGGASRSRRAALVPPSRGCSVVSPEHFSRCPPRPSTLRRNRRCYTGSDRCSACGRRLSHASSRSVWRLALCRADASCTCSCESAGGPGCRLVVLDMVVRGARGLWCVPHACRWVSCPRRVPWCMAPCCRQSVAGRGACLRALPPAALHVPDKLTSLLRGALAVCTPVRATAEAATQRRRFRLPPLRSRTNRTFV